MTERATVEGLPAIEARPALLRCGEVQTAPFDTRATAGVPAGIGGDAAPAAQPVTRAVRLAVAPALAPRAATTL